MHPAMVVAAPLARSKSGDDVVGYCDPDSAREGFGPNKSGRKTVRG